LCLRVFLFLYLYISGNKVRVHKNGAHKVENDRSTPTCSRLNDSLRVFSSISSCLRRDFVKLETGFKRRPLKEYAA
jgi:hypothetical protein